MSYYFVDAAGGQAGPVDEAVRVFSHAFPSANPICPLTLFFSIHWLSAPTALAVFPPRQPGPESRIRIATAARDVARMVRRHGGLDGAQRVHGPVSANRAAQTRRRRRSAAAARRYARPADARRRSAPRRRRPACRHFLRPTGCRHGSRRVAPGRGDGVGCSVGSARRGCERGTGRRHVGFGRRARRACRRAPRYTIHDKRFTKLHISKLYWAFR
jgi:hypothetical protein